MFFEKFIKTLFNLKDKFIKKLFNLEDKLIVECLFYDVNNDLEEISYYAKDLETAKLDCKKILNTNAKLLIDDYGSTEKTESEVIADVLQNKNLIYNYCGIIRIQIMIKRGTIEGIENNNVNDVINRLLKKDC